MATTKIQITARRTPAKPTGPASERIPITIAAQPSHRGSTGCRTVAIPAASMMSAMPPTRTKKSLLSNTLSVCAGAANR
jgi:hypothetical protein